MNAVRWMLLMLLTSLVVGCGQDAAVNYKDLLQPLPPVPDAENGWLLAKDLPQKKVRPESKAKMLVIFPGDEKRNELPRVDRTLLAEYQRDNTATIATARKILQLPGWQRVRNEANPAEFVTGETARPSFFQST